MLNAFTAINSSKQRFNVNQQKCNTFIPMFAFTKTAEKRAQTH